MHLFNWAAFSNLFVVQNTGAKARITAQRWLFLGGFGLLSAFGASHALASPLPFFPDPELQACFDEQASANNWQIAEDVHRLNCSDRNIIDATGVEQLPNLADLNLSKTRLHDLYPLRLLRGLTHLRLNEVDFSQSAPQVILQHQIYELLMFNPDLLHLGLNGFALADPNRLLSYLPSNLLGLELANTGLVHLPYEFDKFDQLQVLDLSNNPLEFFGPAQNIHATLLQLDLSETRLYDLHDVEQFTGLTHLFLNDIAFSAPVDPYMLHNSLDQILSSNPQLTHLGLNGIPIPDPYWLFNQLSPDLQSLALSGAGLSYLPFPLDSFSQLESLNLSHNPLEDVGPLYGLRHTLRHLDVSGTKLHDLYQIAELRALEQIGLNDIAFSGPVNPSQLEASVNQLLSSNPDLTHVGLNGIAVDDSYSLFGNLSPDLVSLELSGVGLTAVPAPLDSFPKLKVLDLSDNPLESLGPMLQPDMAIERLNLSNTNLFDLFEIHQLHNLVELRLNHVNFTGPLQNFELEQELNQLLLNNPRLTHVGLNGFAISDPQALFDGLSTRLISLEMSNTGLMHLPAIFEQFDRLQVLDLSQNPLEVLGPYQNMANSLRHLNLSETRLYDLYEVMQFTGLTHLFLNDIAFSHAPDPTFLEDSLNQLLTNNPGLTHVGLNGFNIANPFDLFNKLSPGLVSLELSGTGLSQLPIPLDSFAQLKVLDLSDNPLEDLGPVQGLQSTLEQLNLSGTKLYDLYQVADFTALTQINLNNVQFSGPVGSSQLEASINQLLSNNPRLTHVGLNGFAISDFFNLLNMLSPSLVSLEMSGTGLSQWPVPWDYFPRLEVLDLSHNPLSELGSTFGAHIPLKALNLSGTQLYDLYNLQGLSGLTHLFLNDIDFSGPLQGYELEQELNHLLLNNPTLTHVGLNGFSIDDWETLFDNLSSGLISLELSNTGLSQLPYSFEKLDQLQILDLSRNPLEVLGPSHSFPSSLRQLNLSETHLYDLYEVTQFEGLTRLLLNDIAFMAPVDPYLFEGWINQILMNNPGLTHVGLNGIPITDPIGLFDNLSSSLESLELSGAGLSGLPMPLDMFAKLRVLDLSDNPLGGLGPLYGLESTLRWLNVSKTDLQDLGDLLPLRGLTRLSINHSSPAYYDGAMLADILANNQGLARVELSGIQFQADSFAIFNVLNDLPVTWLDISNTGIFELELPAGLSDRLEYLDASKNGLTAVNGLFGAQNLRHLDLADNNLSDIAELTGGFPSMELLSLLGNDNIACPELDALESSLSPGVEFLRPTSCQGESLPTDYCSTSGGTAYYEWIDAVSVNGVTNQSGNNDGYGDYSAMSFSVVKGDSVFIHLTPGFSGYNYYESWGVWIDYNNDGQFDPAEKVLARLSNTTVSGSFVVPHTAIEGPVRMRVAMQWGGDPSPCGSFGWGEVEDYSIFISN